MRHQVASGDGIRTERSAAPGVVLLSLSLLGLAVYQCRNLANDDAYITYRYARNLVSGLGFVFNPGERVLGTTTPLYTLLLTPWAILGSLLPPISNTIGCLCVGLQAWAAGRILARLGANPCFATGAAMFVVGGGIGSYWHVGMETNLLAALMTGSIERMTLGRLRQAAVLVGLATLCRADAILLAGLLALEVVVHQKKPWRVLIGPLLGFAAIVVPWTVFSLFYFGTPFPNSFTAKLHSVTSVSYLLGGGIQLARSTLAFLYRQSPTYLTLAKKPQPAEVLWAIGLCGVLSLAVVTAWRRREIVALPFCFPVLLFGAYAWIRPPPEHTWHLYPATVILYLALAGETLRLVEVIGRGHRPRRWLTWAGVLGIAVCGFAYLSRFAAAADDDLFFGRRARTLGEMGQAIVERVPPGHPISILEIGIIGYLCPNPIVDRAGIVTPGLSYHHSSSRTSMHRALRLHPTDYLVVDPIEYRLVASRFDLLKVVGGYGYTTQLLMARPGAAIREVFPQPK